MNQVVSVLLPVYQPRPDYFYLALYSVLHQSFTDFEVLVIEPVSEENQVARRIIEELADDRVRYLPFPGLPSLVDQLNYGLQEAASEFIARMDADDWSHPDRFAEQVDYLRNHPGIAVVGSQIDIMDANERPLGQRRYPIEPDAVAAALCRFNPIAHPSVMYRKEAVLRVGGYRYRRFPANEDYELWCRLAQQGYRLANLSRALLRYRIHSQAMKSEKLRGIIRGTRLVKCRYFRRKMKRRDTVRFWAEGLLLILPTSLVMHLFQRSQYRRI